MEGSETYVAYDEMIRRGWVWSTCTEFKELLDVFEQKGLITADEHESLLALAEAVKPCLSTCD